MSVKTIVQIGACVGNDHVTQFASERLFLVEANPVHLDTLKKEYPNGTVINKAIVPSNRTGTVTLWHATSGSPTYQHCSINREHLLKHNHSEDSIHSFSVEGITLEDLLNRLHLTEISTIFLDVEGIEEDIVKEFPFDKFNIDEIQIEVLHVKNLGAMEDVLRKYNYNRVVPSYESRGYDNLYRKCRN